MSLAASAPPLRPRRVACAARVGALVGAPCRTGAGAAVRSGDLRQHRLWTDAAAGGESGVEGTHGTGYRFMPCFTVNKKESALILCIAGAYPGLTAQQLAAPSVLPFAPQGQWNYHMLNAGRRRAALLRSPRLACCTTTRTRSSSLLELEPRSVLPRWSGARGPRAHRSLRRGDLRPVRFR